MGCGSSTEADITPQQLVGAASNGSPVELNQLLEKTRPELRNTREYQLLLHTACQSLRPECVSVLLNRGFPPNFKDQSQFTPLHVTIKAAARPAASGTGKGGQALEIVQMVTQYCRQHGPSAIRSIDVPDANGTPLLLAIALQQEFIMEELLSAGFDITAHTIKENNNALHLSVSNVHQLMTVMQVASDKKVKAQIVNEPNVDGNTPLHLALMHMTKQLQQLGPTAATLPVAAPSTLLIEDGCYIDIPNNTGQTAAALAVDCAVQAMATGVDPKAYMELLRAITKGKVSSSWPANQSIFDQLGSMGQGLVHVAVALGDRQLLESLKSRGANMDLMDCNGRLPAVIAAKEGHKPCLEYLLGRLNADALRCDRSGDCAATAVLASPTHYHNEDIQQIFRTMIKGWGASQRQAAVPLLCLACSKGLKEVVQLLVKEGQVPANKPGAQSLLPLGATVQAHSQTPSAQLVKIAEFLIDNGANPVEEDMNRHTPLGQALESGNLDMAMVMLRKHRSHVDHVTPNGSTALFLAIKQGATALATELLSFKASTGLRPGVKYLPLHVAVEHRNVEILDMLIKTEQGRQAVAVKDGYNKSIHDYLWAGWKSVKPKIDTAGAAPAFNNNKNAEVAAMLKISELVLTHPNCDVNALDSTGMRPLHWAVTLEQVDLVRILASREHEINPNLTDAEGVTPLFKAVQGGNQTLVETMLMELPTLDFGAASKGGTVLQAAISAANVDLVRTLIVQRNVRVDRRSFDLCLSLVAKKPWASSEIMSELLKHRGDDIHLAGRPAPNMVRARSQRDVHLAPANMQQEQEEYMQYPLHHVVHYNNKELVQLLVLKAGAFVDEKDWQGITPLHHAVEVRAYEAAAKLVALGARVDEPSGGSNPLIAAVTKMDPQMVKELLKSKSPFDINSWDSYGYSAFSTAIRKMLAVTRKPNADDQRIADNGLDIARQLIKAGADVNEPTLKGSQWLAQEEDIADSNYSEGTMGSPRGSHISAINPLATQQLAMLYAHEEDPMTPLVAAICVSNKPVVDLLLSVDSVDINGKHCPFPAAHMALRCIQSGAGSAQVTEEPPPSSDGWKMPFGKRPMQPAVAQQQLALDLMRADALSILRAVASDDKVDLLMPCPWSAEGGPTVLMQLASMGGSDTTKLVHDLLLRGKELGVNTPDPENGQTALHVAAACADSGMLEVLMKAKNINLNALDKQGRSPLAAAVAAGNKQAVLTMLAYGLSNVHAQGPLDPCKCGSDPSQSPIALAIANPMVECLEALVGGLQGKQLNTRSSGHYSDRDLDARSGRQSVRDAADGDYEVAKVLNGPVDTLGRPAVFVCMLPPKLDHARVLVQAGARLDVKCDPAPASATKPAGPSSYNAQLKTLYSPFGMACQYLRHTDSIKDKSKMDEARRLAIYMAESETLDISDGSELQWAVITKREDIVEPVAARAQAAGTIDKLADVYKGQKLTALELAVKLDALGPAKVLVLRGAKIPPVLLQDPALKQNPKMHALLTKPPQQLATISVQDGRWFKHQESLDPSASRPVLALDEADVVQQQPPTPPAPPVQTAPDYPEVFRTALINAVGTAGSTPDTLPATPVSDVLEAMLHLAMSLLSVASDTVQLHGQVFEIIKSALQSQLPTLQALQNECEQRRLQPRGGSVPRELLPCMEALGGTYVQLFKRTTDWCTLGQSALITHMLSTKEQTNIRSMTVTLHIQMLSLCQALDRHRLFPKATDPCTAKYAFDRNALDERITVAMSTDLQDNIHVIYASVLLSGDVAQQQANKIFRDVGLQYTKVTQKFLRDGVLTRLKVDMSELQLEGKIGGGAQATVFKAIWKGQMVAYKKYPFYDGIAQAVANEAFMLSTLTHPNVLHMHGVVREKPHCGLVVDYHREGSLQQFYEELGDGAPAPSMVQRVTLAMQIARGMAYLHSHKLGCIVHGDLKPSNILIAADRRAVIDFGLTSSTAQGWTATQTAFYNPNGQVPTMGDDKSAIYYQAPEVPGQLLDGRKREAASDVFAFGVLLFELMTLKPARTGFASNTTEYQRKIEAGYRPTIPQDLPADVQFVIENCWDQVPEIRPDFVTIVDLLDQAITSLVEQA